jgi:cytochrome c peroxidase
VILSVYPSKATGGAMTAAFRRDELFFISSGRRRAAAARNRPLRHAAMFQQAFPGDADPITQANWGEAIGAYERTLVTLSRFDAFLAGKSDAPSPTERDGLRRFIDVGCTACHDAPGVGDDMFQKFGVVEDHRKKTGSKDIDKGRFDVTHDDADLNVFKVPACGTSP